MRSALLSAASTHTVVSGSGIYYGLTYTPGNGGTIVLSDSANAGATAFNLNNIAAIPSTLGVVGPALANAAPVSLYGAAQRFNYGLTVSYTSTTYVWLHYDI